MIDMLVKSAAEEFARHLSSSQPMTEFQKIDGIYQNDPDVRKMREEYVSLARVFQKKQLDGSLTQEEIRQIRKLQAGLAKHPVVMQHAQAQQRMVEMLQACNTEISEILGFNFSATAAPAASC